MELGEIGREREQKQKQKRESGKEDGNKGSDQITRLSVNKAADKAIGEVLERVNDGFDVGSVNKAQIASWIILRFAASLSADDVSAIRAEHTNEIVLLEHYLRKAKENGHVQAEMRDLMRKLAGIDDSQRKPSKKSLQKNGINDVIATNEAAAK